MALRRQSRLISAHPAAIRLMHWVWVYAIGCMVFSGWEIYNASPSLPFSFPSWSGLGGWLGGALAWHLSAMWLLALVGMAYLVYGLLSGHFRRELAVPTPRAFMRDFRSALRFRLGHRIGHYNAVQRPLEPEWGAPVRIRIPTKLGFKSAKHLQAIEVTRTYPGGFWENQGYDWFAGV
jgi:thiosulfate reductase cytochrome b subunit